jgi:glycosyltransferase involved in cell wall biosynthesis
VPRFVADLAEHLVREHPIDVDVIAPHEDGLPTRERIGGVNIERFHYAFDSAKQCVAYGSGIPDNLKNDKRARRQLPAFCTAMGWAAWKAVSKHDLIHAHWIEPGMIALLANFPHRRPVVVTVHSPKPKLSFLARGALRQADRVLFNSEFTKATTMAQGGSCQSEVVYQGFDDRLFGAADGSGRFRQKLGIPDEAAVVTFVGRMIELKGVRVLAEAASAILSKRPDVHLVMAGDGPSRPAIEATLRQSDVSERVHLPGALTLREVADVLADSDVFVSPGIVDSDGRAEALGLTVIEAMASRLPCVGTAVGGIAEIIQDGVTGLVVKPNDAAALASAAGELLDDADRRERMGLAAREWAHQHVTWRDLANRVAAVYKQVLDERT